MLSKRISSVLPLGLALALLGLVLYAIQRVFFRVEITFDPAQQWMRNHFFLSQYTLIRAAWVLVAIGTAFFFITRIFRKDWLVLVLPVVMVLASGNAAALVALAVQSLAGLAVGIPLWRWFRNRDTESAPGIIDLVMAGFLGGSINAYLVWIAIHWPVNYAFVYWSFLLVEIAVFHRPLIAVLPQVVEKARRYRLSGGQWTIAASALLLLPYALVPYYLCDDMLRHLYFPKQIALFAMHDFNPAYAWALDTEMYAESHYAISYLLGGELAIRLSNFSMAFLAFLVIEAYCRQTFGSRTALCVSLVMVSMPLLVVVVGPVFLESFNLLSVTVLTVLVLDSLERITPRRVCLFFMLSAVAYLYKQQAVFLILPLGVVLAGTAVVQWRRGERARSFWAFFLGPCLAIVMVAPFMVQNFVLTGNPIFPWMNEVFRSPYLATTNLGGIIDEPLGWSSLSRLTFHGDQFGEHGRFQLGVAYFVLLAFSPLVFLGSDNRPRKLIVFGLFVAATVLWWKISSPNLRYSVGPGAVGAMVLGLTMDRLWSWIREYRLAATVAMTSLVLSVTMNLICQLNVPYTCRPYPLVEAFDRQYDGPECQLGHTEKVKGAFDFIRTKYGTDCRCLVSGGCFLSFADYRVEMLHGLQYANWQAARKWRSGSEAFDWIFGEREFDCLVLVPDTKLPILQKPAFLNRVQVEFSSADIVVVAPRPADKTAKVVQIHPRERSL